jgi:uncharacterized protein YneR/predicted small secreted protein
MKKIIIISILILCLVLASCEDVERSDGKRDVKTGLSDVDEESKGAGTIPARTAQLSGELKELMDKAKTVESLKYYYQSNDNVNFWVYVKGNKIKQEFSFEMIDNENYDTVYLDTDKKTAVVYCEDDNTFYCEDHTLHLEVNYNDYITKTPFDILELIRSGDVKSGTLLDGKETVIYETKTKEGYDMKIWLWTYKGIPVKYELYDGNEKIKWVNYQTLSVNDVSSSDLSH